MQSKKVAAKPPFSGGIHFEFGFFIRPSNLRILFANVKRQKKIIVTFIFPYKIIPWAMCPEEDFYRYAQLNLFATENPYSDFYVVILSIKVRTSVIEFGSNLRMDC